MKLPGFTKLAWVFSILSVGLFASSHTATLDAAVITQWDFNSTTPDANTSTGATTPNINLTGSASASLVGGTTATFASGDASGGSSDPASGDDTGWNVTTWPAASDPSETRGVEFLTSTVGYQDIQVSWDQRHSNSASRFFALHYTTDGATWTKLNVDGMNASPGATPSGGNPASTPGLFGSAGTYSAFDGSVAGAGDDWFNTRSANLNAIPGANNNPLFGIRILSSHDSGSGYVSSSGNAYATTGTARFDMVTIAGTLVPEPTALAWILCGGIIVGVNRRIRK